MRPNRSGVPPGGQVVNPAGGGALFVEKESKYFTGRCSCCLWEKTVTHLRLCLVRMKTYGVWSLSLCVTCRSNLQGSLRAIHRRGLSFGRAA